MTTTPKDPVDALMAMPDPEKLRTAAHYLDFPFMAPSIKEQHEAAAFLRQCADYLEASARALAAVPASPSSPVYLVATGEVHEGQETYTRHDARPPLCDAETLYTSPQQAGGVPAGWNRNTEALRQYGEGEEDTGEAEAHAMLKSAPERIWLNVDDYPNDHTEFPADHEGITWCTDEIGFKDVPYIRADLAAAPSPSAVQPLSEAQIDDEYLYGTSRTKIPMAAFMQGVRFAERHYGIVTPKEPT